MQTPLYEPDPDLAAPETATSVVTGVEPGGRSTRAVVWAAREAERTGSPLHLVTAISPSLGLPALTEQLRLELLGLARRLVLTDPHCAVVEGTAAGVLLDRAREAALLVVGRRGFGAPGHLLTGSTPVAVAQRCGVPVVMVPETWSQSCLTAAVLTACLEPLPTGHPDPVSPLADPDRATLRFAFGRAAALRVPLIVVSVGEQARGRRHQLERRLAGWRRLWPEVEVVARELSGPVTTTLLVESDGAQLLVLGRHSSTREPELRLGDTVCQLLQRCSGPVAVVPFSPDRPIPA